MHGGSGNETRLSQNDINLGACMNPSSFHNFMIYFVYVVLWNLSCCSCVNCTLLPRDSFEMRS